MTLLAALLAVAAFVDPFIGTKGTGHCFPGAAHPFDPCGGEYVRITPQVRYSISGERCRWDK